MRALSASELLAVWEQNWRQPPLWQGLALLAAACPDEHVESLAQAPIGRYNERLLTLRLWHFGPSLTAVTKCPGCGELVEVTLDVATLRAQAAGQPEEPWLEITHNAGALRFRLPALDDLMAAGDAVTIEDASQIIVRRCAQTLVEPLSPELVAVIAAAMEQADPLAVIELGGACPNCGQAWSAFLDVASFLWSEVQTWAQRTLQEIHLLARAYGWREAEILEMSPMRRQTYLRMVYG
ncbi:MAG: hypothetical protein R6W76_00980 [Caldilinea sp.]